VCTLEIEIKMSKDPANLLPLNAMHEEHGSKMVPFAGYSMPLQYSLGILGEHLHTRCKAGLFDVSHMGQAWIHGDRAAAVLEAIVPGDIQGLREGQSRYSFLMNGFGGITDDLIVTNWGDKLGIVVNASRKDIDFPTIADALAGKATLEVLEEHSLLALQGPYASRVLELLGCSEADGMPFMSSAISAVGNIPVGLSRCGYTGEDGYELSIPNRSVATVAESIIASDAVKLAGLGARDTLRLEAGLCLYGKDLDEYTSPIEAGLGWTIPKHRRELGDFLGSERVLKDILLGPPIKRVGIFPLGRSPAREGTEIYTEGGDVVGKVTSGGYGPSVGQSIAMGYVSSEHSDEGTGILLSIRGKMVEGKVTKMPFHPHHYYL
jgi:aminomethyltransferase